MAATALPTFDTTTLEQLAQHVTVPEAAELLGRSESRVRQMIAANNFRKVWALGAPGRKFYLLNRAEVERMAHA